MHMYLYIQNNYTHIYYVNTNFYFGFWIAIYLCTVLVKIYLFLCSITVVKHLMLL